MNEFWRNPTQLVIVCCLTGLVLGMFSTLYGLWRGDSRWSGQAAKWGQAFGGGREGQRRQNAEYDELRKAVSRIEADQKRAAGQGGEAGEREDAG